MSREEVITTKTDLGLFVSEESLSILTRQRGIETINDILWGMPRIFRDLKLENVDRSINSQTLAEVVDLAARHDKRYAFVVLNVAKHSYLSATYSKDCTFNYVVPILRVGDVFSLIYFSEDSGVNYSTPNRYMVFRSLYVDFCGFKKDDCPYLMDDITDEFMAKLGMVRGKSF